MHMRTTLIINDAMLADAMRLTGLKEKTAVVHAGLEALIRRESARRLALRERHPDAAAHLAGGARRIFGGHDSS